MRTKYALMEDDVIEWVAWTSDNLIYGRSATYGDNIQIPLLECGTQSFPKEGVPILSKKGNWLKPVGFVPFNDIAPGIRTVVSKYVAR